jgi:pimeloyl-ACP methyl ester carboxylesterase
VPEHLKPAQPHRIVSSGRCDWRGLGARIETGRARLCLIGRTHIDDRVHVEIPRLVPAVARCVVTDDYVVGMECRINEVAVHYVEHGSGVPLVALHGAGVDHREIEAAIEAIVPSAGYRRIYPDLPGMGRTATDGLTCNDDVVRLLGDFLDHLGAGPVMLLGHSYGAYLARGVVARRPDTVLGLALLCPVAEQSRNVPDHDVVRQDADAYDELEPAHWVGFDEYFVVRTPATARRYRDHVVPGTTLVDEAALGRIFAGWTVDIARCTFSHPTLIAAGRRDSVVGYTDATALLERYPHATLAVIEDAGHALMHERPDLLATFLGDWLDRAFAQTTNDRPVRQNG